MSKPKSTEPRAKQDGCFRAAGSLAVCWCAACWPRNMAEIHAGIEIERAVTKAQEAAEESEE